MRHSRMKLRIHNKAYSADTYCNQTWLHTFTAILYRRCKFTPPKTEKSRCKNLFKFRVERQDLHPSISLSARLKRLIASLSVVPSAPKEKWGIHGGVSNSEREKTTIRSTKSGI